MAPKVLLVDDVTMFLDLQKVFLKLSSVQVLTAKDGAEALKITKKERPELIFMDLHMPNMDGAECCARIKSDKELRSIPVVMITSEGKADDMALCYKAGCDDFLTKPIDRNLFLDKARRFLPAIDRRDTRIPCRTKCKFKVFGLTLSADIMDVSGQGVYVSTDYEVEAGSLLELVFALREDSVSLIQAKGRVAWINSNKQRKKPVLPVGFGVEFVAMTDESRNTLKLFMEMQK